MAILREYSGRDTLLRTLGLLTRVLVTMMVCAATLPAQAPPPDARMMRGDDIRWAHPAYDDSHWDLIAEKGLTRWEEWLENRLWIRSQIIIPESQDQLALVVRFCGCEIYLNGLQVGAAPQGFGTQLQGGLVEVFWLPRDIQPGPALLAVRYALPPGYEVISALWRYGYPQVLPSRAVQAAVEVASRMWFQETAVLMALVLTAVLAGLYGQRFDLLAKLICAYLVCSGLTSLLFVDWGEQTFHITRFFALLMSVPLPAFVVCVVALLAGVPVRAAWIVPYACVLVGVRGLWLIGFLSGSVPAWTPWVAYLYLLPLVWGIGIGLWCLTKISGREWIRLVLLIAAVATLVLSLLARIAIGSIITTAGISQFGAVLAWDRMSNVVFGVLAAIFLVRRARERRIEEARLKSELEAARTVQSLLLGQSLPTGVEAVYFPASEVGGDFYQAWDTAAGTLLVAGDVSGKGLQAAMTVSTIVGAIRAFCHLPPGQLLAALNQVLSGHGGFVTCCCVLATPTELHIANAGHPAPYLDGVELALNPGLPLGIVPDAEYTESIAPRPSQLTLVSDGVIEAANASGELLGFERTQALMGKPAKQVAEAAKAWGQTDDITVVRLH